VIDYKTNLQITKELKITPILEKLLEYRRNWIQHVNRMPRNRLPRVMKHYSPNWQKELWQTFEETSGYVRPERVNKWPNSVTDIWHDCFRDSSVSIVTTFRSGRTKGNVSILVMGDRLSVLRNIQTGSGSHPAFYSVATGVKRPGRDTDHSPPSSADVENE